MRNGIKSEIGTSNYLLSIAKDTIFDGFSWGFTDRLKDIGKAAANALNELYDDLGNNKGTVCFLEKNEISLIEQLSTQLSEVTKRIHSPSSWTHSDIESRLKSFALPSKYSLSKIKQAFDKYKRGRLKIENDKELLKWVMMYEIYDKTKHKVNKGKNKQNLGSKEYSEEVAVCVFGERFVRSSAYKWNGSYKEMLVGQIKHYIEKIRSDIKNEFNSDKYMPHDERQLIINIVEGLSKYCSGSPSRGIKEDLQKLRRLEDFNNMIIKIERTGIKYPIDVELFWQGGNNILKINVGVFFVGYANPNVTDPNILNRKASALLGFEQWGGLYSVFGNQEVNVEMNVYETMSHNDAVWVNILDSSNFLANLPKPLNDLNTSMSWGGKGIYNWSPDSPKVILLRHNDSYSDLN